MLDNQAMNVMAMDVFWDDVIKPDLKNYEQKDSIEKYPPPENCLWIDPPTLSPEVKLVKHESVRKRDSWVISKQQKIEAFLSATGKTTSITFERENMTKDDSSIKRVNSDTPYGGKLIFPVEGEDNFGPGSDEEQKSGDS